MLYAASTLAMAVLESAARIDDSGLPLNRYVVELVVPDAKWNRRRKRGSRFARWMGRDSEQHGVIRRRICLVRSESRNHFRAAVCDRSRGIHGAHQFAKRGREADHRDHRSPIPVQLVVPQ